MIVGGRIGRMLDGLALRFFGETFVDGVFLVRFLTRCSLKSRKIDVERTRW